MRNIRYRFLYCDQCGWYYDITEAGLKAQCHECTNKSLNYLCGNNIQEIYDRLFEIQLDIGVRFCKSILALNKDLAFFTTEEDYENGMEKFLNMEMIEKEFCKRRGEALIKLLRKEL